MEHKRITILCGHYGSGKTNIAVNLALMLRRVSPDVTLADMDIVNPYYRAKDSDGAMAAAGIRTISSVYANSNVDMPALPQEIYSIVDERGRLAVVDVGGDDRGALALGLLVPKIKEENNYEMLFVINKFRPLTRTPEGTMEVLHEIESACRLPFTAIVNNSNLGVETTPGDVLGSLDYAKEVSALSGLPIKLTTAETSLCAALEGRVPGLFPLSLQKRPTEN